MVNRDGFSLVEVIVAMVLLSIALLAIEASGLFAARMLQQARSREQAAIASSSIADSLLSIRARGSGLTSGALYQMQWTATDDLVVVRTTLHDGSAFDLQALP